MGLKRMSSQCSEDCVLLHICLLQQCGNYKGSVLKKHLSNIFVPQKVRKVMILIQRFTLFIREEPIPSTSTYSICLAQYFLKFVHRCVWCPRNGGLHYQVNKRELKKKIHSVLWKKSWQQLPNLFDHKALFSHSSW